ncbi:MAG: GDP-mannose 4,6-dehydratase, partial [Bacteroidetes bacterium]|nr:GDP-mannose 4,6-dehydratase [Bacteroidota bacterium]
MRVLVTGIDGFVGSHTAEFLLRIPGVEVHGTVLDPFTLPNIEHIRHSLHLHKANLLERELITALFNEIRPDRVIHLAGQAFVPTAFADPVPTFQANVLGGVHVLEAARLLKTTGGVATSVLVVSTGEVYGKPVRLPITEDLLLVPNNPYAASKASIDIIAQQYGEAFGLNVIVVRPFNHAGPRQSPMFVCSDFSKQIAEVAAGKREPRILVGNIDAQRDFTDVRDVVRAYWLLLERTRGGTYNVCSGKPRAVREILDTLSKLAGTRIDCSVDDSRLRTYDIPVVYG